MQNEKNVNNGGFPGSPFPLVRSKIAPLQQKQEKKITPSNQSTYEPVLQEMKHQTRGSWQGCWSFGYYGLPAGSTANDRMLQTSRDADLVQLESRIYPKLHQPYSLGPNLLEG